MISLSLFVSHNCNNTLHTHAHSTPLESSHRERKAERETSGLSLEVDASSSAFSLTRALGGL